MRVCMIEEESPNDRKDRLPLAARASRGSGADWTVVEESGTHQQRL